jgi:hypothetical protein
MGFASILVPNTHNTDPITTAVIDTATTITRTNIGGINGSGGTGTIIGTITIETMIGTTTGIEAYEIITFCPCAGLRRINFSIL